MSQTPPRITGRQLTIMVLAICAAVVLAPAGVMAASHSRVSIADGKHPSRTATVTKNGAQVVSGSVKLAGTSKISGNVNATLGLPGTPYNILISGTNTSSVPAGKHFVVTNISVALLASTGAKAEAEFDWGSTPTHYLELPIIDEGSYSGIESLIGGQQSYVILNPGEEMSLDAAATSGNVEESELNLSGYLV